MNKNQMYIHVGAIIHALYYNYTLTKAVTQEIKYRINKTQYYLNNNNHNNKSLSREGYQLKGRCKQTNLCKQVTCYKVA